VLRPGQVGSYQGEDAVDQEQSPPRVIPAVPSDDNIGLIQRESSVSVSVQVLQGAGDESRNGRREGGSLDSTLRE
jgi:hypothetical protein